jgi:crotonobetainyl-CoA:carnitine CoA-transferase CaiB-like acyl-CoA transferase
MDDRELDKSLATQAPLTRVRVVDFGHYIAGPLTGMLLADQGAEVIKIDRPGKPDQNTPINAVFNRGKKRLTLDLKTQEGISDARTLIKSADIVIENFRPGVMTRLGLGPKEMTALNPRLIYLSLPGFYSTDSERANIRAFEGIVAAATGLYTDLLPATRRLLGGPPVYTPLPSGSIYGAVHGAIAVTLALYAREESGRGDVIEVSLAAAAMSAMGSMMLRVEKRPPRYGRQPSWLTRNVRMPAARFRLRSRSEEERQKLWRSTLNIRSPFFDSFQTGDGKWVHFLASGNWRLSTQLIKALGIYQDLINDGMVDRPIFDDLSLDNNVRDPIGLSGYWNSKVRERMSIAFMENPASHWTDAMREAGVPFSVHRTTQEWLKAPEPEAAALTVTVDDLEYGPLRQLGVQTTLSKTPEEWLQPKPAIDFAGNVEDPWSESSSMSEVSAPMSPTAPKRAILQGIRVLDLSTVLAGPCCARTLAEYGADVIKIDQPEPYFGPNTLCWSQMEVSQGKRSIILNLKTEEGSQIFRDLVKTSDIIVHNMSPGTPERLGIDYESIRQYKPDIVIMDLTAFNGPRPGPWGDLKGFDPVLQAALGIQTRYGGEGHKPVLHGAASCIDYLTGYSGTFGAALALYKRRRSGEGDLARTSLAQGGQLIQGPFMYSSDTHRSGDEPQGQESQGEHSLQWVYKARDGHLFLGGLKSEVWKLKDVPGLSDVPHHDGEDDQRVQFLGAMIQERSVDYWVRAFNQAGLGCHRVDRLDDIRSAYLHRVQDGASVGQWYDGRSISISRMMDHPVGSPVDNVSPAYAHFDNAEIRLTVPMPKLGAHTREILLELGYSIPQIDAWTSTGVAQESFHEAYLPS